MRAHSTHLNRQDWIGNVSVTCRAKSDLLTVSFEKAAALRDAAARSSALSMASLISSPLLMHTAAYTNLPLEMFGYLSYTPVPQERENRMWN